MRFSRNSEQHQLYTMEETRLLVGNNIYLVKHKMAGEWYYDIRAFAKAFDSTMYPTMSGVCMTPTHFLAFIDCLPVIQSAYATAQAERGNYRMIHVINNLYVTVCFGNRYYAIRHHFKATDGRILPTRRGVNVPEYLWQHLRTMIEDLDTNDEQLGATTRHQDEPAHDDEACLDCFPFGAGDLAPEPPIAATANAPKADDEITIILTEGLHLVAKSWLGLRQVHLENTRRVWTVPLDFRQNWVSFSHRNVSPL